MVGTRSADYIRASGHSGRISKAVYMAAPDPLAEMSDFLLHRGRRPYMALRDATDGGSQSTLLGPKPTCIHRVQSVAGDPEQTSTLDSAVMHNIGLAVRI
jgi:hypothetical protein